MLGPSYHQSPNHPLLISFLVSGGSDLKPIHTSIIKMGFFLGAFAAATQGQSLSTFVCSPTSILHGASTTCTVTLTAYAPSFSGISVQLSTTATGLTVPPSITV